MGADGVRRGRRAVPPPAPGGDAVAVGHARARRAAARDRVRDGHDRLRGGGADRAGAHRARDRARRRRRSPCCSARRSAPVSALAFSATDGSRRWRGEPHDVGWLGPLAAPGMRTLAGSCSRSAPRSGSSRCCCPRSPTSAARPRPAGCCSRCSPPGASPAALVYGARSWPGRRAAARGADARAGGRLRAARRRRATPAVLAVLLVGCGCCSPRRHRRRLDAARHRRPARHRHRGVHGDGDGDRGRHGGRERARRRARRRGVLRGGRR